MKMAEIGDDLTTCPVCFEDYHQETGDRLPRLLPCGHTMCEKCMMQLLRWSWVLCPECRTKHVAPKGVKTFPQNKYILTHLRRKIEAEKRKEFDICPKHKREMVLYCSALSCHKPICPMCLKEDHKNHDFEDLQQETEEQAGQLLLNLESTSYNLQSNRAKLLLTKGEINTKFDKCLEEIEMSKQEYVDVFNALLIDVKNKKAAMNTSIGSDLADIDEKLLLLDGIKQNPDTNTIKIEEIKQRLGTIDNISTQAHCTSAEGNGYQYVEYDKSQVSPEDAKRLFGCLIEKNMKLVNSELNGKVRALSLSCSVLWETSTDYDYIWSLNPLPGNNNSLVVGGDSDASILTRYNLQDGVKLSSTQLTDEPFSSTTITIGGEVYLVLSYTNYQKLEIRSLKNLNEIKRTLSVKPNRPEHLCVLERWTLLYATTDGSKKQKTEYIGKVDLRHSPAKHMRNIVLSLGCIWDLCYMKRDQGSLLVTVLGHHGVTAYNLRSDEIEWHAGGRLPGMDEDINARAITTDGNGRLFVCDADNESVLLFQEDGKYLGYLLTEGEQGLGKPRRIRWSETTSSLIVAHEKEGTFWLSAFKCSSHDR